MCLMCIPYREDCSEVECIERAKKYTQEVDKTSEVYYRGRSGLELFLYQGYGLEACEHIKKRHADWCDIFNPEEYYCNCAFDKEAGKFVKDEL